MRADTTERDMPAEAARTPDGAATPGTGPGWLPTAVAAASVLAGWGMAVAVLAPQLRTAGGSAGLTLATTLSWWLAVVAVVRSDLRDFIIPDEASAAIALLGLVQVVGASRLAGEDWADAVAQGGAAAAVGASAFGLFWLVGAAFRRFGQREALGFGDVKLAGASAIWLTAADATLALEAAALAAIAVLLVGRLRERSRGTPLRETAVPFGAFMAPAAWLAFVLGPAIHDAAGPVTW